jgi:hypothetical protein
MAVTILVGMLYGGDVMLIAIYGVLGGIIFGAGGGLIGNVISNYVMDAAFKEIESESSNRENLRTVTSEGSYSTGSGENSSGVGG